MYLFKIAISAGSNPAFLERALEEAVKAVEENMDIPGMRREVYRAWVETIDSDKIHELPICFMTPHGATCTSSSRS